MTLRNLLLPLAASLSAALLPAGTPGGTPARVVCTVWRPVSGVYARLSGPGAILPDGGIVLPPWPDAVVVREDLCSAQAQEGAAIAGVTPECACSSGSSCLVDGGAARVGLTLAAETFTGAGCVPKVCGELLGVGEDWPAGCPRLGVDGGP